MKKIKKYTEKDMDNAYDKGIADCDSRLRSELTKTLADKQAMFIDLTQQRDTAISLLASWIEKCEELRAELDGFDPSRLGGRGGCGRGE